MKVKRIMVPLGALAPAAELARDASATLVLVRAAEAPMLPGSDPTEAQVTVVRVSGGAGATAPSRRHPARGDLGLVRARRAQHRGGGPPPAGGTHRDVQPRRSGLGRLILGSVAESVLRATSTSILLVRAPSAPVEAPARATEPCEAKESLHA
jgi:nucleotide-binding universal stress UspA family protein